MAHLHDPNSEVGHIAELLHKDQEKKANPSNKLSFTFGFLIGASLLSALIIGGSQVYTHYKDLKMEEYRFEMESLEKQIREQQERQKKLNMSITQLRVVYIKAARYCEKKPIPESKMDELEDQKVDAIGGLVELHFDIERLFNPQLLDEVTVFTDRAVQIPLCDGPKYTNEMRLNHVKVNDDMQALIEKNISKLKKIRARLFEI